MGLSIDEGEYDTADGCVWGVVDEGGGAWAAEGRRRTLIELNVELIEEKPEPASNEAMTSTTTTKDHTWLAQHTYE